MLLSIKNSVSIADQLSWKRRCIHSRHNLCDPSRALLAARFQASPCTSRLRESSTLRYRTSSSASTRYHEQTSFEPSPHRPGIYVKNGAAFGFSHSPELYSRGREPYCLRKAL